MTSSGELTGAAVPPPPSSSSPPSPSPSGILLENEDRSMPTIDFGLREQLRGLGEELIRLEYDDAIDVSGTEYVCAWSGVFSDLLADADPDLHDTLHPYVDPDLLESHGEKLLGIVIRLASPQQWREWIGISADIASSSGASGVFLRLLASWGGPVDNGTLSGLLRSAAKGGSVDILSALISAGAGPLVRMVDEVGRRSTVLRKAAEGGHRTFVAKLIEAGAPDNEKHVRGITALAQAIRYRHKGVVIELIAGGADVSAMQSIFHPRTRRASFPLSHRDFNPLYMAIQTKDEEMVDILLEAGAEPSKEAMNVLPLHTAARQGSCHIINSLLKAGARVDAVDTTGCSALHLACANSHYDAVDLLLRHNASVALMSNGGLSPVDVVGAQVLALREWSSVRPRTTAPIQPTAPDELERELLERGVDIHRLGFGLGSWIAHPSTLSSAETSTVDTICDMLQATSAWGRRGWLVMMRSRPLAEVVTENPDRSDADAFTLSVRDIVLVQEPSSNRAVLRDQRSSAQAFHDGEHATTDWSAAVVWLLRSPDDSLFRDIVRFL